MGTGTDIGILTTIFFIMIGLGITLPFINSAFSNDTTTFNSEGIQKAVGQDITPLNIGLSVASMFFWTFGILHPIFDAFFIVIRIIFYVLLFKVIRGS